MRAGLLCNPRGGRLRKRKAPGLRDVAADIGAAYAEAVSPAEISAGVDALLAGGPDVLAVAGGDGTVQAVLTHLFTAHAGKDWPLLTLIPAGTTNMTALDLGVRGSPQRCLRRLARALRHDAAAPARVRRPVLRIRRAGEADLYGMFFGAGGIASGVRYFQRRIRQWGLTSELAGGLVMLWLLAGLLLGRSGGALQPAELDVKLPHAGRRRDAYLLVLASSLHRLLLGMRPYWGDEAAPVHVTLVRSAPPRFWRSLPSLLFGRGARLADGEAYISFNTGMLELDLDGDFIIDGELHAARSADGPLTLAATEPVTFLVP